MSDQLTSDEAAELLGCSVSFIRKAKQQGRLSYTQFGSRYTFDRQDVLNLIKKVDAQKHAEPSLE